VHQDRIRTKIEDAFDPMAEIGPTRGNPVSGLRSADNAALRQTAISSVAQRARYRKENGII
jgi:hypothetical protein